MSSSPTGRTSVAPWPSALDYNEAVQNLRVSMSDEELRAGIAVPGALGLPMPYSGGFADVYKVACPATGNTWAVKFFKREIRGLRDRYREISEYLAQARLPFMVDFHYLDEGVRIGGRWYPIVKLQWVEGLTLNEFVAQSLDQPRMLEQLLSLWVKLAGRLRGAGIAHADLQHGNVMLVPRDDQGNLLLKLIDYDGMWVPALAGRSSGEVGHRHYQHPRRAADNLYSAEVDRFSHLAICCALRCLSVGGRPLWERFDNGDNLLFKEADFASPGDSVLFRELWTLRSPDARALVGRLTLAAIGRLEQTPWVDELVTNGRVQPLPDKENRAVRALLDPTGAVRVLPVARPLPSPATATPFTTIDTGAGPTTGVTNSAPSGHDEPAPVVITTSRPRRMPAGRTMAPRTVVRAFDGWLRRVVGGQSPRRVPRWAISFLILNTLTLLGILILALTSGWNPRQTAPDETGANREDDVADESTQASLVGKPQGAAANQPVLAGTVSLSIGMTLKRISRGEFRMGADTENPEERPAHRVVITRDFYLGSHEVTQAQYRTVMGKNPSRFQGDDRPAESVTWDEAQEFCRRLTQRESGLLPAGWVFRLPTEAEWEYACRGGTTGRYGFGGDEQQVDECAWHKGNAMAQTQAVGKKKPNAWGLYDVHGNVWEWCQDPYNATYYVASPASDPSGPPSGFERVRRGGSWRATREACRSSFRFKFGQSQRYDDLGFRVAAGPSSPASSGAADPAKKSSPISSTASPANSNQSAGSPPPLAVAPFQEPEAKQHQQAWAKHAGLPVEQEIILPGGEKLALILIPPGDFTRVAANQKFRVRLTQPFYLGKYEVTQAQWQSVMGTTPSVFKASPTHPVETVSWNDIQPFLAKLNEGGLTEQLRFDLPTEAQWEYACRAGTVSAFSFGDNGADLPQYGWFDGNANRNTHPVGKLKPNPFGLHDLHGNVREWCSDWYDSSYYAQFAEEAAMNPQGPSQGVFRVMRGGGWDYSALNCLLSFRSRGVPSARSGGLGFRVALAPTRPASPGLAEPSNKSSAIPSTQPPASSTTPKSPATVVASPGQASAEAKLPLELLAELRQLKGRYVVDGAKPNWSSDSRSISYSRMPFDSGFGRHDLKTNTSTSVTQIGKDQAESPTKPGRYAYARGNAVDEELWLTEPDKAPRRLAAGSFPAWSSDGRHVIFHQPAKGQIMSLDVESLNPTSVDLADVAGATWYPSFTSDGKWVAFMLQQKIVALHLQDLRRRTWPLPPGAMPRGFLSAWSPDARFLTFASFGLGEGYGLWLLDTQSSEMRKVLMGDAAQTSWSPDGRSLAIDVRPKNANPQIWLTAAPTMKSNPQSPNDENP